MAGGDGDYCAILVAVNSILQMVLFAPLAVFFIRVISHESGQVDISYPIVATSVAVFLGIPLGAAVITRFVLRATAGPAWFENVFLRVASPWSLIGLLYTILVLFASQGHAVVHQIVSVLRVAAPLVVYFVLVFFMTLWATKKLGFGYALAATQSFTAASNNFELAIAVAVATFGPESDQALASTVGPLIEVPVLLCIGLMRDMQGVDRSSDQMMSMTSKILMFSTVQPAAPSQRRATRARAVSLCPCTSAIMAAAVSQSVSIDDIAGMASLPVLGVPADSGGSGLSNPTPEPSSLP